ASVRVDASPTTFSITRSCRLTATRVSEEVSQLVREGAAAISARKDSCPARATYDVTRSNVLPRVQDAQKRVPPHLYSKQPTTQLIATSPSGTNSLSCNSTRLRPAKSRYHSAAEPITINNTRSRNAAATKISTRYIAA